jgi:CheY-like chemotaxis protein
MQMSEVPESRPSHPPPKTARPSVLIVEDERVSRKALSALLATYGYATEAVGSAEDALRLMKTRNGSAPRIAVIDLNLPGMNGIDLIRHLEGMNPDIRPVLVTGAGDEVLGAALRNHPVSYLRKPVDFRQLLSLITPQQPVH